MKASNFDTRPAARLGSHRPILALLFLLLACAAGAAKPGEWHLIGDTMLRTEEYRSLGDPNSAPYQNTGRHTYQNLALQLSQENTPYDRWLIEYAGLWNNSFYRSRYWGGETERFRLVREKGDSGLPYRLEAGDIYASFSSRTFQRSLKGVILDLQPKPQGDVSQSMQIVYGRSQPDWKYLHESDDANLGFSWLYQNEGRFRAALSSVWNTRDADPSVGTLERRQNTTGLAFEHRIGDSATLEGELARFVGDHDGVTGPASGLDHDDWGRFLQLIGGRRDFQYRLSHESQGGDFRPVGGSVAADRRSWEGFFTWNLEQGRSAVLRLQRFQDAWESDNARWTNLSGLTLRGPVNHEKRITGGINLYSEMFYDDKDTARTSTRGLNVDLSRIYSDRLTVRLGWALRTLDNAKNDIGDNRLNQLTAGFDRAVDISSFAGRFAFDVGQRLIDAGGEQSREWFPALGLSLHRREHDLGFYYRFQRHDRPNPLRVDVDTADLTTRYAWRKGDHQFGIDYLQIRRHDSNGLWTRAHQTSFWYQYAFDTMLGRRTAPLMVASADGVAAPAGRVDIWRGLKLGADYAESMIAARSALGNESRQWNRYSVFEGTFIDEIAQRQRLVLSGSDGRLERLTILIDADSLTGLDVYERVRRGLLNRYGAPAETYEFGKPSADVAADVQLGQVIRAMEWRLPDGVLRLTMPRRLDGRLKIEVSLADSFPPLRNNDWGLDLPD